MAWKNERVGVLRMVRAHPTTLTIAAPALNATKAVGTDDEEFSMSMTYGNIPHPSDEMFLTAIKAMAQAAEEGLDTTTNGIRVNGIWSCKWELARGSSLVLRNRHSREALHRAMVKIVENWLFRNVYVILKLDGRMLAVGGGGGGGGFGAG